MHILPYIDQFGMLIHFALLQLTLWHSCKRPFGTLLESSHNIKANCLCFLARKETPVSFKLALNSAAALPCRATLGLLNQLVFNP